MDVILVYPFRKVRGALGAGPPLSLLYIATYLNKKKYRTKIIDLTGEAASNQEVISNIVDEKPSIVGLPVYSASMKMVHDFIVELRKKGYLGKIAIGAQHATALPMETMECFPQVDYLIKWEAEVTFMRLAEYVIGGSGELNKIPNLYYRQGVIKNTADVPNINKELDDLPFPDRSLLDKYYKEGNYNRTFVKGDCDYVITSRGCPFRCNFCFPSAAVYRSRSPRNIVDELIYLKELNRKHIEIMDDTFTVHRKHVEDTLNLIISQNLKLSIKLRSRVDLIDEKLLKLMKEAGVDTIVYGIESGVDGMLKTMNKRTTVIQNERAIRLTKKANITCFADLFIGYPGESRETIEQTTRFLLKTRPAGINVSVFTPFPQTKGAEVAESNNMVIGNWFPPGNRPCIKPEWAKDPGELHKMARQMRRRFYFHPIVFFSTVILLLRIVKVADLAKILLNIKTRFFVK